MFKSMINQYYKSIFEYKFHFNSWKGCDGWIRVWDLESIFNAKAIDTEDVDKTLFCLDPMNEVQVEVGAILKSIVRSKRQMEDHNDWYLQVKIWKS